MGDKEKVEKTISSISMATGKWLGIFNSEAFSKCLLAGFSSAVLTRKLNKLKPKLKGMLDEHIQQVQDIRKDFFELEDEEHFKVQSTEVTNHLGELQKVDMYVPLEDADLEVFSELVRELEEEVIEIKFPPFDYTLLDADNYRNKEIYFTQIDHEILGDLVIDDLEEI